MRCQAAPGARSGRAAETAGGWWGPEDSEEAAGRESAAMLRVSAEGPGCGVPGGAATESQGRALPPRFARAREAIEAAEAGAEAEAGVSPGNGFGERGAPSDFHRADHHYNGTGGGFRRG